jgi:hypothetical protein
MKNAFVSLLNILYMMLTIVNVIRIDTDQVSFAFYFFIFKDTTARHGMQLVQSALRIPKGEWFHCLLVSLFAG